MFFYTIPIISQHS